MQKAAKELKEEFEKEEVKVVRSTQKAKQGAAEEIEKLGNKHIELEA